MNAIETAISIVGGQAKLAAMLKTSRQNVHNWVRNGRVPPERATMIETATGGKVRAETLCPDFPWPKKRR